MEWLQTYRIGKALIDSGQIKPIDIYYQSLNEIQNNYLIPVIANLKSSEVDIAEPELLQSHQLTERIKEENFFVRGGSSFRSAYLCTPFSDAKSILDFLGIDYKNKKDGNPDIYDIKAKYLKFLKPPFLSKKENKIEEEKLSDFIDELPIFKIRKQIQQNADLSQNLRDVILNLKLLLDVNLKKEYDINPKYHNLPHCPTRLSFSIKDKNNFIVKLRVIDKQSELFDLNKSDEYREMCFKRFLVDLGKLKTPIHSKCYFSGKDEVYDVGFPRDSYDILKISTNSEIVSPNFIGHNFLLSKDAYVSLKVGANYINKNLRLKLSGINHYIIPDFRTAEINVNELSPRIKQYIDVLFQPRETSKTLESLHKVSQGKLNSITFIGYVKGKGTFEITSTIKIPSITYFDNIFICFNYVLNEMDDVSKYDFGFSFKSIYGLFVERYKGKSKDPLFKPKSLQFFKMILEKQPIDNAFLLDAYKQLINVYKYGKPAKEGDSYYGGTLNVWCGKKFDAKKFDDKISKATKKYQVLFNLIRKLGIERKKTKIMDDKKDYGKLNDSTQSIFKNNRYKPEHKALFFLGKMIHRVANAQHKKGAKHKPVLDKINYSGMNFRDIIWLGCEIFDKMRQYNKSLNTFNFGENDMAAFKFYFDQVTEDDWSLSEIENVFSIFSGYALYWDTIEKKEDDINKEKGITRENTQDPIEED